MKRAFLISLISVLPVLGICQAILPKNMSNDSTVYQYPPLIILQMPGKEDINLKGMTDIDQLNPDSIQSVTVLKDSNTVKIYGNPGKYGVVLIKTKSVVKINESSAHKSLNTLLVEGKPVMSYHLPVYVDNIYVKHPENAYLADKEIQFKKIDIEEGTGIKYINIGTYTARGR